MSYQRDEFRKAAADCLKIAQATTDQNTQVRLLMLTQKFMDLASGIHLSSEAQMLKH
jgi:hypothetical protein